MLKNSWLFPAIQSVHIAAIAMLAGAIAVEDFRAMGFPLQVPGNLKPWMHRGLALLVITGLLLFFSDAPRYLRNPAFWVKMFFFLLAAGSRFLKWKGKLAAVLSLVLWTCVVLGGRAIADFDVF